MNYWHLIHGCTLVSVHQSSKAVYLLPKVSYQNLIFGIDLTLWCILMDMPFKKKENTHNYDWHRSPAPSTLPTHLHTLLTLKTRNASCGWGNFFSGQGRGDYGAKSRLTLQTPASLLIYKWSEGFYFRHTRTLGLLECISCCYGSSRGEVSFRWEGCYCIIETAMLLLPTTINPNHMCIIISQVL